MKLTIIYDNDVYTKDIGLQSDWGFSCLIETGGDTILFDTGANGNILQSNMQKLGIDPSIINKIVISHEHWDHNGGLKALEPFTREIDLFRLARKCIGTNIQLISAEMPQKITEGAYTTGRLKGLVPEQSLVLKGNTGWYVLVGCSHPGVAEIFDAARKYGDIVGLVGGLHGFNDFSLVDRLDFICPCHCTEHKQKLKELYPKKYTESGVGSVIEI